MRLHDVDRPDRGYGCWNRRRKGGRLSQLACDSLRARWMACASRVRLGPLTQALVHLAWAATHTGEWDSGRGGRGRGERAWRATPASRNTGSRAS